MISFVSVIAKEVKSPHHCIIPRGSSRKEAVVEIQVEAQGGNEKQKEKKNKVKKKGETN